MKWKRDNYLRKMILIIICLFTLDQGIKLLTVNYIAKADIEIIPGILSLTPCQNTNFGFFAIVFGVDMTSIYAFLIPVISVSIITFCYRYLSYLSEKNRGYLKLFLSLAIASMCCLFADVVFWGGSWDYIGLFNLIIADLKDLYLFICLICILIWYVTYVPQYFKLEKAERKQYDLVRWIRKGCPTT